MKAGYYYYSVLNPKIICIFGNSYTDMCAVTWNLQIKFFKFTEFWAKNWSDPEHQCSKLVKLQSIYKLYGKLIYIMTKNWPTFHLSLSWSKLTYLNLNQLGMMYFCMFLICFSSAFFSFFILEICCAHHQLKTHAIKISSPVLLNFIWISS